MKINFFKFFIFYQKQKARQRAANREPGQSSESQQTEEQEKLQRIKETGKFSYYLFIWNSFYYETDPIVIFVVDDAIVLVQKKLNSLSHQLKETDQLEVAIEIARRVRTAKKVLFPPGEEPKTARVPLMRRGGLTLESSSAERQVCFLFLSISLHSPPLSLPFLFYMLMSSILLSSESFVPSSPLSSIPSPLFFSSCPFISHHKQKRTSKRF